MSMTIDITKLGLTLDEMARATNDCDTPDLLMEAAQCAWEHALDCHGSTNPKADTHIAIVKEWTEGAGCAEVRYQCRNLARPICIAYAIMGDDAASEMGSYDWDFVPWFMRECVDWDNHTAVSLRGDWLTIVRTERAKLEKQAADRHAEYQAKHGVVVPPAPETFEVNGLRVDRQTLHAFSDLLNRMLLQVESERLKGQ